MEANVRKQLIDLLSPIVNPLGYEIVHVEVVTQRQRVLRVFIDHLEPGEGKGVGIEDCVAVTRALDEPMEKMPEFDALFKGAYELEVSSPGVDRPLHSPKDFQRFSGRDVRIHLYRPATAEELGNSQYHSRNPKQKNFLGKLVRFEGDRVHLEVSPETGAAAKKPKKSAADGAAQVSNPNEVTIPLPLISKANLEPDFDEEFA